MEKPVDLETKYEKLAAEYSKIRSQAAVLKRALLDEQAKSVECKDIIKQHEQQLRKHDQEMESLMFRNEQLTKRILVLQQELQPNNNIKKSKSKSQNAVLHTDMTILDEELQKKILENAQLVSSMADKEFEISSCKEKTEYLEKTVYKLQQELQDKNKLCQKEILKLKQKEVDINMPITNPCMITLKEHKNKDEERKKDQYWKEEAERWKKECELLKSKPSSHVELTNYYESQISDILEAKRLAQSETKSLWADNLSLSSRLENAILDHNNLKTELNNSKEELVTTNQNYKLQLDAMTEHLAAQNDKITKQSDEIEILKHKVMNKK